MLAISGSTSCGSNCVPAPLLELADGCLPRTRRAVRALLAHRGEGVGDPDDACLDRDVVGCELPDSPSRSTTRGDGGSRAARLPRRSPRPARHPTPGAASRCVLGPGERPAWLEDAARHPCLAEVVQQRAFDDDVDLVLREAEPACDLGGEHRDPQRVSVRAVRAAGCAWSRSRAPASSASRAQLGCVSLRGSAASSMRFTHSGDIPLILPGEAVRGRVRCSTS